MLHFYMHLMLRDLQIIILHNERRKACSRGYWLEVNPCSCSEQAQDDIY